MCSHAKSPGTFYDLFRYVAEADPVVDSAFQHNVVVRCRFHAEAAKTLRVIGFDVARNNRNVHRTNRQHG